LMIPLLLLALLATTLAQNLIDLGPCKAPPCFRIKNNCNFTSYAYGLGGCCGAFTFADPAIGIPNDGAVHEFPFGCGGHGRVAFGPNDPNSHLWYGGEQVYSLLEPGPSAGCGGINYDTSYIDTGFLMPLAARAQPCQFQGYCGTSYTAALQSAPSGWVKQYKGQSYVLSFSRYCKANPNDKDCVAVRATAKKLASAVPTCADPQVDTRDISQITGCGGGPWSANSGCCAAVNFGLVDFILRSNMWDAWNRNTNCTVFYANKYSSAYNLYQKWIEDACHVKYQYGFPYADHCGWSSDLNCDKPTRLDLIICPLN